MTGYKITVRDTAGFVFDEQYLTMNDDDVDFSEIDTWTSQIVEDIVGHYRRNYFGRIYAEVESY